MMWADGELRQQFDNAPRRAAGGAAVPSDGVASELVHDWEAERIAPSPAAPASAGATEGGERPACFTATGANPARGEVAVRVAGEFLVLRPSFAALVAAEGELGPLFALVERAAEGRLGLGELVALFWHCLREAPAGLTREGFGEALTAGGLAAATPPLRVLLGQILAGR